MSASEPTSADAPLADAVARLERAVSRVGARLEDYQLRLSAAAGDVEAAHALYNDRARLAAALDEARAREDELQGAAEEATQALDDAMADLQALLAHTDESGEQA
ncbi:hypothetical protein OA2633_07549 [Oceanicaulis sp. HTCC2633]|uniref:DUF4164 family protein n=1 Tax=Oceanicaulis sp. HTCC2633 TaxID=314254 RepID=UPI000066A131|nr:DUF4164 family protein [Oceanicaulis sp. HTCC2633]EAP90050.1 hypothetical protein OA2633_07549 [Oceanicaulis sp. HTCC2633]